MEPMSESPSDPTAREKPRSKSNPNSSSLQYSTAGATSPTQAQERGERRERAIVGALCLALLVPPSGRAGVRARHCARGLAAAAPPRTHARRRGLGSISENAREIDLENGDVV